MTAAKSAPDRAGSRARTGWKQADEEDERETVDVLAKQFPLKVSAYDSIRPVAYE
ncbi:hypothetical protein [Streptomyces sp. NRRL S-448]|uniref:hypothetical protein n=1 Tax=Streptomyces sp. NRRL S-448 TaxID=1463907 RepID=UPI000A4A01E8